MLSLNIIIIELKMNLINALTNTIRAVYENTELNIFW